MIPKECRRLAEVDFPVAEVSRHSAREKSIRHGHPSTLHLWWARRPLAACRAMLMALLLPDPCDPNCPAKFKEQARKLLRPVPNTGKTSSDLDLRRGLLQFIADFANWDNSANATYLECARGLVKAAHGDEPPLVVDPFAGGGSIPLEALRVGCDAFASDLNPVACLILKVLLEDIPRHGPALAEELRRVGKQIKEQAEKELAEFYPVDPDGARPIAYLWARTVRCESVGCGAEIPLMRSFWLCKKANRRRALRLVHEKDPKHPKDPLNMLVSEKGAWRFEIHEPKSEAEVHKGTVARGNATCPCCNTVLPVARVRAQLSAQRGGADVIFDPSPHLSPGGRTSKGEGTPGRVGGARLLTVVTLSDGQAGRQYRLARECDYAAVYKAMRKLKEVASQPLPNGLSPVPDESIPLTEPRRLSVPLYGCGLWREMHTTRQNLLLTTLAKHFRGMGHRTASRLGACVVSKVADKQSTLCGWKTTAEYMGTHTFSRQALGMVWDFCEANPCGSESGSITAEVDWVSEAAETLAQVIRRAGSVSSADACSILLPTESAQVWFTDPPYYDAVPYSHLSDFFFVWLKRCLALDPIMRTPVSEKTGLTPKNTEIVVDRPHSSVTSSKTASAYETRLGMAFARGRLTVEKSGVGCVIFAHKSTEGWESLIGGLLGGGWSVRASWPVTTEMGSRLNARETAALAASVHLVCRPRPENAGIGGWEDILRELPKRIGDWMDRLSGEGIRGADLVFSCIGPALELFSKYEKVETAEGREVKLSEFLEKVWEVVGRTALQQILGTAEARARNSAAGALEEDARLTALFLWTLQSTNGEVRSEEDEEETEDEEEEKDGGKAKKGYVLIYDVARRFAQPLGIHLENWEDRVIETKKGVVRLIPVAERAEQLFGKAGTQAVALAIERSRGQDAQFALFPDEERVPDTPLKTRRVKGAHRKDEAVEAPAPPREATTLDRVHAAMLLQAGGQAGALRALLEAETERSPDFLRLANALSALYPKDSEEKRLLDAMLLACPK